MSDTVRDDFVSVRTRRTKVSGFSSSTVGTSHMNCIHRTNTAIHIHCVSSASPEKFQQIFLLQIAYYRLIKYRWYIIYLWCTESTRCAVFRQFGWSINGGGSRARAPKTTKCATINRFHRLSQSVCNFYLRECLRHCAPPLNVMAQNIHMSYLLRCNLSSKSS